MTTVSLKQAKKLFKLGYPQGFTEMTWNEYPENKEHGFPKLETQLEPTSQRLFGEPQFAAPSIEELINYLSEQEVIYFKIYRELDLWHVYVDFAPQDRIEEFRGEFLITALFDCTCWFLKNKM